MPRSIARRLLALAVITGLIAGSVIYGAALGADVPLLVVALLAFSWLLRPADAALDLYDLWLPFMAVLLSGSVAVRADPVAAVLDSLAAIVLTALAAAAIGGRPITRGAREGAAHLWQPIVEAILLGTAHAVREARLEAGWTRNHVPGWAAPLGRGLVLGVPLAIVFAVLFASADPIFSRGAADLLNFRIDLADLPGRVLFTLAVAWFAGGLLSLAATAERRGATPVVAGTADAAAPGPPPEAADSHRRLGVTEALVVLVAVDLVFGLFVGLQLAYLFGGLDTLAAVGLTYSEYARRGYFELVLAAMLAVLVIFVVDKNLRHRAVAYIGLALGLAALTLAVLASAALRLSLYLAAYGWTELRLWVAISIIAMAALLLTTIAALILDRVRWLGRAVVVLGLVSLVSLSVVAPPAFVAARNIERAVDPRLVPPDGRVGLDAEYLAGLSDDAVPTLVRALPALPRADADRVRAILVKRRAELEADPSLDGPGAWNLGRLRAREALATMP
ncbi:MAG TPA: DUF4153 domain-containing protein [Candidatus Limnocylindrales bacterium]